MGVRLYGIVVDSKDPQRLAAWWADALGWRVVFTAPDEVAVAKDEQTHPGLVFVPVSDPKTGKNRLHLDLAPDDRDTEVARLEELGARRVDVGQSDTVTWVVLADPEGNEFCVLSNRPGGV
jgi:predicted enzyme related to lactoylglutathione lyase